MDITKIRPPTGVVNPGLVHKPESAYRDGFPIALTAGVTVAPYTSNKPNVRALANPTPYPIEISEIRFNLISDGSVIPGCVGVKLNAAGNDVSQDYVPLWLLDHSRAVFYGETDTTNDNVNASSYLWKLVSPIVLMPGEVLVPEFFHLGLITDDITCTITQCGRVMVGHPKPSERIIPFIAIWQGASLDMSFISAVYPQVTTEDTESTELNLVNTTEHDVLIHYMTGRLLVQLGASLAGGYSDSAEPILDMIFSAQLRTSKGYEITQQMVPFRHLFSADTRSLRGGIVLEPGDYIMAQVQASQGNIKPYFDGVNNNFPSIVGPVTPQIGIVGERSVPL